MDGTTTENTVDLREYLAILRARKWTILLVTCLVLGSALYFSLSQAPVYTAQAKVLVEPLPSEVVVPQPDPVNLKTQVEIVASEPVAARAREELGLDESLEDILANLDVSGIPETEVLEVRYTSQDPEFAAAAANSFAESYISYRKEKALEDVSSDEESVRRRLNATSSQLAGLTTEIEAARRTGDEGLVATLETSRNVLIARLGVLQQRIDDIAADRATQTGGGSVIEAASVPGVPSAPNHMINVMLGLILGLGLGTGAAFLRERLDDRFRDRGELERTLEVPVLATVPRYRVPRKKEEAKLVTVTSPNDVPAEAYRGLRTNLQFIALQQGIKTILITSPSASEGKTVTTANVANLLAQAGRRVIVVSADMRRPTLEEYFGLSRSGSDSGLAKWLVSDDVDLSSLLKDPGIPNIRVLPSGHAPLNPAELLSSPRLAQLIEALEANADYVLIDSPPVLAVADASIIASQVGGTVLVVDAESTHRSATLHARDELRAVEGRLLGCVFNGFDPGQSPYYYGRYYGRYKPHEEFRANGDSDLSEDGEKKKRGLFRTRK